MNSQPHPSLSRLLSGHLPLVIVAAVALMYYSSLTVIATRWSQWHESLSHGWMVVAVFVYLLWLSLPWPARIGRWHGLTYPLLTFFSLCWLALQIVHIVVLAELAVLALVVLALVCVFGWGVVWHHKTILLLPLFASSLWGDLTGPLVNLSGWAVGSLLSLFSITAHVDGNSIFLPYGHIVIADGCSGLRYLVIALSIGYIQACLNDYAAKTFVATLLFAAILGLVANWLRIFILVLVGSYTQMQSSLMRDHELFGWALFAVLIFIPLYFSPTGRAPVTAKPPMPMPHLRRLVVTLACLSVGLLIYNLLDVSPHPVVLKDQLSSSLLPVMAANMPLPLLLSQSGHEEQGMDTARQVYIQINQYQRLSPDEKLVPYLGRLFDMEQWLKLSKQRAAGLPWPATLSEYRNTLNQRHIIQLQWFVVGARRVPSITAAKLWQLPAIMRGANNFDLVTLQANCERDCKISQAQLYASALEYLPVTIEAHTGQ